VALWRQLTHGLRALIYRSEVEQDISDEVQHYLQEAIEAHMARGLTPEEAARKVRLEVGSRAGLQERVRTSGWENGIETVLADLRYAWRQLRSSPLFTSITVWTVAIGVGATTAIFGAVSPILFEPLPYPDPERIVTINEVNKDGSRNDGTFGMYRGLLERNRGFEAISVFRPWQPTITGTNQTERFNGQRVSSTYFDVLGINPVMGRKFRPEEDRLYGPKLVILSSGLWHRRFGGDSAIIGRAVTLDEEEHFVIGVMPREFENVLAPSAEIWSLLQYDLSQGSAWGHHLRTIGKLKSGVTMEQASKEVDTIGRSVLEEYHPVTYGSDVKLIVRSLQEEITEVVKPALLASFGAAFLVLLIACVNVANLLLARGVQRRGEFALRAALGAGGSRLIRQIFTESLFLALIGGAMGMMIAAGGVRMLSALGPADLPRIDAIRLDENVFLFGLMITTLLGFLFGLIPARNASRGNFHHQELQQSSRRFAGSHRRVRNVLVVCEVALSLVLLVSSGLLWRSMGRLFAVDEGFDPEQLLTVQVQTSGQRFDGVASTNHFYAQILENVKHVSSVTGAAFTSQLPLSGDLDEYGVHFEATPAQPAQSFSAFRYAVSPGYFETMRIPLRRGRSFNDSDRADAPHVAIISESLAKIRFPQNDPIGERLRIGPMDSRPYTIIGVVKDVKQRSLALSESSAVYVPATQWQFADNAISFVIRSNTSSGLLIPAIRQVISSVDQNQAIVRIAMMKDLLEATAAERRFAFLLFQTFALAALTLAAAGIYGVLAGNVAERTREIGVRSALGASRRDLVTMVIRQGLTLTAFGIAVGLIASFAATHAIVAMLFQTSPLDPLTYGSVIALLATVAFIASGVPAWRASRVDPATTLRAE
jgi:putative ABC transport system permease protein